MWYLLVKYVLVGPWLWLLCRPRVVGADNIAPTGPVIVAANHTAFIDSLVLCLVLRRKLRFVAKSEYFAGDGFRDRLRRWFFTAVGQIPIDRRGAADSDAALREAVRVLDAGQVWAIHPEGSRSSDGVVHRGHTGVIRVAQQTGVPVVPVGLRGTARVNPRDTWLWRPGRVEVVFGRPLGPEIFDVGVRAATDRLMTELAVLVGQEYRDVYVSRGVVGARTNPDLLL